MALNSLLVGGGLLDTGSRPSIVDDGYRFLTYNKLFIERSSKIFEDLRCNSAINHGSNVDILVCGSLKPVLIEENNKMHETQPVSVWLFNFNQL